jgi:hypothetical protein
VDFVHAFRGYVHSRSDTATLGHTAAPIAARGEVTRGSLFAGFLIVEALSRARSRVTSHGEAEARERFRPPPRRLPIVVANPKRRPSILGRPHFPRSRWRSAHNGLLASRESQPD